jgi:hypothetical protein
VSVLSREGQHVSQNIVSPTEQNIIVTAENGNQNIYKIFYTYTSDNNAFLTDILLNGESISNFHRDTTHYVKMLDWRTRVVPCVQPVGTTEQIITTYHSAINGRTHIHVESLDRLAKRDYYIDFPVRKSSNVALEYIDMDVLEDAIYHNQIDPKSLAPFKQDNITYRLNCSKAKILNE